MSEIVETAVVKSKLLDGLLTEADLEAETGWTYRTRLRREAEGLPVIKLGATKFYPADKVRDWILSRVREHAPARGRGRPRKKAVA
jgi:hypothetical protein